MDLKKQTMRDWTPVRKGAIFCSPACGGGCKREDYEIAIIKANALAKRCTKEIGGEWVIHVHENLGWHWSVIQKKTNIKISKGGYGNYYAAAFAGGTPIQVSLHPQTFDSPKEAYDAQVNLVKKEANKWNSIINNITQ